MKFNRLRLSGFKSFVDPVELHLQDGLTGIVGPNGCGKSNLVEALRWVMGENSAKAMRGDGMDDVIFAGSQGRAARNIAEVTLLLDNSKRRAPAAFNDSDELEISRRIERDSGSAYRINGREARARDVQILFADAATGSHSPSIVSQGRVGQLINAKPRDRRSILESAAGISGLHARRHEAELRLKGAEENLLRLADVMGQIEVQLANLKRQARHALRYQKLSAEIRSLDAMLLYLRWTAAGRQWQEVKGQLAESEAAVAMLTREAATATTHQAEVSALLPDLRLQEAEAAARLHRMATAIDLLAAEGERVAAEAARLDAQCRDIGRDIEREKGLAAEAASHIGRLDADIAGLAAEASGEAERQDAARNDVASATQAANAGAEDLQALNADLARLRAEAEAQRRRVNEQRAREEKLRARFEDTDRTLEATRAAAPDQAAERLADERIAAAEKAILDSESVLEKASTDRVAAQARSEELRDAFEDTKSALARLQTEEQTLSRLLSGTAADGAPPVLDAINVKSGFEAALGAALGEDLDAPLGGDGPLYWETLAAYDTPPALPAGAIPLSDKVEAPAALARRLSQIGIVAEEDGQRLQAALQPGQRLVSKRGSLWRWDGFTARHGAPTVAAARLEQKNRLKAIAGERAEAMALLEKAETKYAKAREKLGDAQTREDAGRAALRTAQHEVTAARHAADAARSANADYYRKLELLTEARSRFEAEWREAAAEREAVAGESGQDEAIAQLDARVAQARLAAEETRRAQADAQSRLSTLLRESEVRQHRLASLTRETASWTTRAETSRAHAAQLQERADAQAAALAELAQKPRDIAERKAKAEAERDAAAGERGLAARRLAEEEDRAAAAERALKVAQERLSAAREGRIRIESNLEQAETAKRQVVERIAEVLHCRPEELLAKAGVEDADTLPPVGEIEPQLDRLKTERERMGPVNLRAEIEARDAEEQLTGMQRERTDLEQAITRLRQAIGSLNREGRERLLTAFGQVNERFAILFEQLFGGGKAHLALTESDDPLDAGLEIMASPPGKKLQVMSLLSGGEQALTALCLIFAVFQTNPSPVCVLDEVDAPLDDANVERLCDLLHRITRETGTRFLVVTHHALTMSRVNQLFGVTMPERGVSQLVSVDLDRAGELRAVG